MPQSVGAADAFDPLDHGLRTLRDVYQIHAGLIQSHGVCGGQNADVVHIRCGRTGGAVAVDGQIVHHIDEQNIAVQGIHHGLAGLGHGVHEHGGRTAPGAGMALAAGVNQAFALGGGDADGDILQGAAEAAQHVALEVAEHQHSVKLSEPGTHQILGENGAAVDGQGERAGLVHDHHIGDLGEPVILGKLVVHGGLGTGAAVGGVGFDDGALHVLHQLLDEVGAQMVGLVGFAGVDLDRDVLTGELYAQGLINGHQGLRGNVGGVVDHSLGVFVVMFQI